MAEEILQRIKEGERRHAERQGRPFTVPEGYFEDFPERMMALLPEHSASNQVAFAVHHRENKWVKWRPYVAVACLCALIVGGFTLYFHSSYDNQVQESVAQEVSSTDIFIDQMADYTMMDNADFYNYLANGE